MGTRSSSGRGSYLQIARGEIFAAQNTFDVTFNQTDDLVFINLDRCLLIVVLIGIHEMSHRGLE